jgi:hypothetical protein
MFGPIPVRDIPILRMALEKLGLALERVGHALVSVDVALRAVHDADEAQLERVHATREYVERVRTRVHKVELRQDADRPPALGVNGPREFERFRVGKIDICGRDGEDDAACARVEGGEAFQRCV